MRFCVLVRCYNYYYALFMINARREPCAPCTTFSRPSSQSRYLSGTVVHRFLRFALRATLFTILPHIEEIKKLVWISLRV
jgi:hypothetical protein